MHVIHYYCVRQPVGISFAFNITKLQSTNHRCSYSNNCIQRKPTEQSPPKDVENKLPWSCIESSSCVELVIGRCNSRENMFCFSKVSIATVYNNGSNSKIEPAETTSCTYLSRGQPRHPVLYIVVGLCAYSDCNASTSRLRKLAINFTPRSP